MIWNARQMLTFSFVTAPTIAKWLSAAKTSIGAAILPYGCCP